MRKLFCRMGWHKYMEVRNIELADHFFLIFMCKECGKFRKKLIEKRTKCEKKN